MQYGICNLSLIPVRKSAGHTSEMTTQLLFGETFDITGQQDNWIQIQIHKDQYTGWIHQQQYMSLSSSEMEMLYTSANVLLSDLYSSVTEKSTANVLPLLMGSRIPLPIENEFHIAGETYTFNGNYTSVIPDKTLIIPYAERYLGAPYLWGGRSHFGIDCSGFTQMVYHLSGYTLSRDASQQAMQGDSLSFLSEAETGDLLFFDNEEGLITHVGLLYSENKIIHASGNVRIDTIDHQGIYNENLHKYTHNLRLIKKY
ncbi:MAG: NlpC/P60 family protein [Bacteroidales bacterium]